MFGRGKKGCSKGKPCGFTCIERDKFCLVDLPGLLKRQLKRAAHKVGLRKQTIPAQPTPSGGRNPETIDAKAMLDLATRVAEKDPKARTVNGVVKERAINWRAAIGSGVDYVGGGEFGSFVTVPPDKLAPGLGKKFPGGVGVKGGEIGPQEAEALRIAGRNGMGPQLIGGKTASTLKTDEFGFKSYTGVLAMSKVSGETFHNLTSAVNGYPPSDIYWIAAARLHRLGIAHNDMHGGNLLVDNKGKGRFVDFGLAQVSPKAALAEALGTIYGGNWQFMDLNLKYNGAEQRVRSNLSSVGKMFAKLGVNPSDLQEIMDTEIRNSNDFYSKGAWGRLSDKDAMKLIKTLYNGLP